MKHLAITTLLGLSALSGCVIYDNDCPDKGTSDGQFDHDRPGSDNGDNDADRGPFYTLNPDIAAPGEIFIGTLISDEALNYDTIVDVEFSVDDVTVCTFQPRNDELLVTVGVAEDALGGSVDMFIHFEDGSMDTMPAILTIITDDGSNPVEDDDGSSDDPSDPNDEENGNESDPSEGDDASDGADDAGGICG